MITIFYRGKKEVVISRSEKELERVERKDVLWIDLLAPSGEEKRSVEAFLGTEIQSRAKAEEIESSSRFSETEKAIFANTNFLIPGPEEYAMEPVSFIIVGYTLTTLREVPLRSFTELQRKLMAMPRLYPNGYVIFATILDQRVDLDADMIELMSKEIAQYSKRISRNDDMTDDFLLEVNQMQENTMIVRENAVDKQRLISNLMKSNKYPPELETRFNVLLQDITSLINHTNFSFERLEYLQSTVVGLVNLDQNRIMKVFTIVSLLLMPPTLVTSFYGMNVYLPITNTKWDWVLLILLMILSFSIILFIFKKRKMM